MNAAETTTVEVPTSVVTALSECRAARDEGIDASDMSLMAAIYRREIDTVIDAFADTGRRFSANQVRVLLPEVTAAQMGARFTHAHKHRGVIRPAGLEPSTKKNTHAKAVTVWRGTPRPA